MDFLVKLTNALMSFRAPDHMRHILILSVEPSKLFLKSTNLPSFKPATPKLPDKQTIPQKQQKEKMKLFFVIRRLNKHHHALASFTRKSIFKTSSSTMQCKRKVVNTYQRNQVTTLILSKSSKECHYALHSELKMEKQCTFLNPTISELNAPPFVV